MNIAVMSPHIHNNGQTTVAVLLAERLARTNSRVLLTHTRGKSESLMPYFSLGSTGQENKPLQVLNLIKTNSMPASSFPNYCRNLIDRLDMFSMDADYSEDISESDISSVINYIADYAPYDYVVYDVDENNMDKPAVNTCIAKADCVILVMSQVQTEINRFNSIKNIFWTKVVRRNHTPVLVCINKYRDALGSIKDFASKIGVTKTDEWYLVHDNLHIIDKENHGTLKLLIDEMKKKNGDVIELEYDFGRLIDAVKRVKKEFRIISNLERQAKEEKSNKKGSKSPKESPNASGSSVVNDTEHDVVDTMNKEVKEEEN